MGVNCDPARLETLDGRYRDTCATVTRVTMGAQCGAYRHYRSDGLTFGERRLKRHRRSECRRLVFHLVIKCVAKVRFAQIRISMQDRAPYHPCLGWVAGNLHRHALVE